MLNVQSRPLAALKLEPSTNRCGERAQGLHSGGQLELENLTDSMAAAVTHDFPRMTNSSWMDALK